MGCGGSKPATQEDEDEVYERERAERERALRAEMDRLVSPREVEVDVDVDVDGGKRGGDTLTPATARPTPAGPTASKSLEKSVSLAKGADVRTVKVGGSTWLYVDGEPVFEVHDAEDQATASWVPSPDATGAAATPPKMRRVRTVVVREVPGGGGDTEEVHEDMWEWGTEDIGGWPYSDAGAGGGVATAGEGGGEEAVVIVDALVDEWIEEAVAGVSEADAVVDALVDEWIASAAGEGEGNEAEPSGAVEEDALLCADGARSSDVESEVLSAVLERPFPVARGPYDLPDGMYWRPASSGVFSFDEYGRWHARAEELAAWSLNERLRMDASASALGPVPEDGPATSSVSVEDFLGSLACAHRATGRGLALAGRELRTSSGVFLRGQAESLLAAVAAVAEALVLAGEVHERHACAVEATCEAWVSASWGEAVGEDGDEENMRHADLLGGLVAAELTLATRMVGALSPAVSACAECGGDASSPFGALLRDPCLHDAAAQLNWCGALLFWSQRGLTGALTMHLGPAPTLRARDASMARRAAACFGVLAIARHDANLALERAIRAAGRDVHVAVAQRADHFALFAVLIRGELRASAKAVELVSLVHADLAKASAGRPMSAVGLAALQQWPKRRRVRRTDTGKRDHVVVVARRTTPREGHEASGSTPRRPGIDDVSDEWDDLAAVEQELTRLTLVDHERPNVDAAASERDGDGSSPVRRVAGRRMPRPSRSGKVVLVSRAKGRISPRSRDLAAFDADTSPLLPRAPSSVSSEDAAEVSSLVEARPISRSSSSSRKIPEARSSQNAPDITYGGHTGGRMRSSRPGSRTSMKSNSSELAEVLDEIRLTDATPEGVDGGGPSPKAGGLSREVSLAAGSDVRTVRVGHVTWLYVDGEPVFQVPDDDGPAVGAAADAVAADAAAATAAQP